MKKLGVLALAMLLMAAVSVAFAQNFTRLKAALAGFEEPPVISTVGRGEFEARINNDETEIAYELTYSGLESSVTQAHIHLGQRGVNGGITVFLCTNLGNGPAGTQPCPPSPATIEGTITASDVSPPIAATAAARAQGLDTGELDELIRAIRAGMTYTNVHSTTFFGGEVRGQIGPGEGQRHEHD
jgi:CHRD domain